VHGFDIPAKAPAKAPAAAPAAPVQHEELVHSDVALPAAATSAAAAAAAAAKSAAPAAAFRASIKVAAAAADSVELKLAAAAAAAERDSGAAASSWQLAAGRIVEVSDDADGCLSSSISSSSGILSDDAEVVHGDGAAVSGPAAAAAAKRANQPAATAADPSAQLLAAYGYSSRVVKLQNPAAAAAAAAAAAGGRVRGAHAAIAADLQPQQQDAAAHGSVVITSNGFAKSDGFKGAIAVAPGDAANHERVCCGYQDVAGSPEGVAGLASSVAAVSAAAAPGLTATTSLKLAAGKADGQFEALGLAAAVARIREAVMSVDVAAAVPVEADGREVWGRKVVRLSAAGGGLVRGCGQYGSARAA
jgi:hypothetical protein